MENKKFVLFSNCIPVKGHKRSIIYDLQRYKYDFIPNTLYFILKKHNCKSTIDEVKAIYNNEQDKIIDEYFKFLLQNEYLFFTYETQLFPKLNLDWDFPAQISNAIIDVAKDSKHNYQAIFNELNNLGCQAIEIRFYDKISIKFLDSILTHTQQGRLRTIELIIKYYDGLAETHLKQLCKKNKRINSISIYDTYNTNETKYIEEEQCILNYTTEVISNNLHCGQINHQNFMVNTELFTESKNYNSCLNRKISIDINGEIKNCPSMQKSYGNIKNTTLSKALNKEGFKDVWNIKKDQIEICKDCEFRYMCTDCRVFIKDENNILRKPAKCSYNPYTATWEDENVTNNILYGK